MMADVVEDAAVSTGPCAEGLLFAANGLISKCVTGLGTFFAALVLIWVSFPQHGIPGQVDPAIIRNLGLVFAPLVTTFSAMAIVVLMFYEIDRSTHQRNLERLENAQGSTLDSGTQTTMLSGDQTGVRLSHG
jgi:Na+/melibiose symporter-like transporter